MWIDFDRPDRRLTPGLPLTNSHTAHLQPVVVHLCTLLKRLENRPSLGNVRRTGTQGLINPKKSCRTNGYVSDIMTCLGNMPEVVLTHNFWVHTVPFLQNSCFSVQKVLIISNGVE